MPIHQAGYDLLQACLIFLYTNHLIMNTNLFSSFNWPAVLVAAVAYFALGAVWYSGLFGKRWVAYHKINVEDPEMKKGVAGTMSASFVLMLVAVQAWAQPDNPARLINLNAQQIKGDLNKFFNKITKNLS